MPTMADITIKKYDGTTDVVYVAKSPSAGDKVPAQWRVDAGATINANKPRLTVSSVTANNGKSRVVTGKLVYPETMTDSTTGLTTVRTSVSASFTVIVPLDASDAIIQEACAQFGNVMDHALIQSTLVTGYAPT